MTTKEALTRGSCRFCSQSCMDDTPEDFNCFDDGCEYECCGCGVCRDPDNCSCTGKGYTWHQ